MFTYLENGFLYGLLVFFHIHLVSTYHEGNSEMSNVKRVAPEELMSQSAGRWTGHCGPSLQGGQRTRGTGIAGAISKAGPAASEPAFQSDTEV